MALILSGVAPVAAQSLEGVERAGPGHLKRLCARAPAEGEARCHVEIATDSGGRPLATALRPRSGTVLGATPYYASDLWSAYYGTTTRPGEPPGARPTVAVVAAFGYSKAAVDLAKYRSLNGLPPLCSSTLTTGCISFSKVNQSGVAGSYPAGNTSWAQEQAIDIQMVSALCPWCNILLVEASTASYANLAKAEVTAARTPGVVAISNSFGGNEAGSSQFAASFSPTNTVTNGYAGLLDPAIAVVASSGDGGFKGGTEFPSSVPYVISVGGTRLTYSGGWSETAWAKAGSGCSTVYSQMAWQSPVLPNTGCAGRVATDVSAVADTNTGVLGIYRGKRYRFGGTSVSAPIIAGIIGQRNQPIALTVSGGSSATANYPAPAGDTITAGYAKNLYANRAALRDITSGSTGTCATAFLCAAATGYDGPTGLGSPRGDLSPF